jgi:hypothetical protein
MALNAHFRHYRFAEALDIRVLFAYDFRRVTQTIEQQGAGYKSKLNGGNHGIE